MLELLENSLLGLSFWHLLSASGLRVKWVKWVKFCYCIPRLRKTAQNMGTPGLIIWAPANYLRFGLDELCRSCIGIPRLRKIVQNVGNPGDLAPGRIIWAPANFLLLGFRLG